jgi:uncharacterized protein YbjT (DUF2867 family)
VIILVTGASGILGSRVESRLSENGHQVRVDRVELSTGQGLEAAVDGVESIVHCASSPRDHQVVDVEGTGRLLEAAQASGSPHLVYPGIVGSDLIPYRYYESKVAAEEQIMACGLPYTIQRATQFHQLIRWKVLARARKPVVVVPRDTRFQPVDPNEVAARLVEAVEQGPLGRAPDMGGPHAFQAIDLARSVLAAAGLRRPVFAVNYPGIVWAAFRAGANLTPNRSGGQTWNEFIATVDSQR